MAAKILVVDDSKLVTDIVKMRLEMYGYEVQLAHSGEDALTSIAGEVPDLMVLDVQMPGMDGYEVCRRLRENPNLDDLLIIMLTSSEDKSAAFDAGVDDYLNKDIDLLNLPNRVKQLLDLEMD
jgi:CheY-like chemotaxis protein